jgi:hypothetical protein
VHDSLVPFKAGNRHIVDRLGALRRLIREAETLEKELKTEVGYLMGSRDSLGGDEFIARQTIGERKGGWDDKKLEDELGLRAEKFRKPPVTIVTIRTDLRDEARADG